MIYSRWRDCTCFPPPPRAEWRLRVLKREAVSPVVCMSISVSTSNYPPFQPFQPHPTNLPHSYVRGIINMPSTESTWTLDPRKEVSEIFDKAGLPRGVGNQVSCEFNLIYRFHPAISNRDAQWTKDFYAQVFPGQDLLNLTVPELMAGILRYEESIPKDPAMRTFAGLKRKEDGTFDDGELVKILKEAIEEPAGERPLPPSLARLRCEYG